MPDLELKNVDGDSATPPASGQESLLDAIAALCRRLKMAELTFGRLAVNDGKLISRLRDGARIKPETLERVRVFMAEQGAEAPAMPKELVPLLRFAPKRNASAADPAAAGTDRQKNFRFFDNRQKYLLFVSTCSEKEVVAARVGLELQHLHPEPPALRVFDAGMGDGSVLMRTMRQMHRRFPTVPFYVVGKEISLEDVRLSLDKMADRLFEHPATVLVMTNLFYSEAPWLTPRNPNSANALTWKEVRLTGSTSDDFARQIDALEPFLSAHWQARYSEKTGNPVYERPTVMIIYREDMRFLLHDVIPRQGRANAGYDLVIASQPYRLRVTPEFKAEKIVAPLVRALRPGGRLIGIHSCGGDPGLEIVRGVWPDENPFLHNRHDILRAARRALGREARHFNFNGNSDDRAVFRYEMNTLPSEVSGAGIGTSTLFAAWNAAVYVNQIDDERLNEALGGRGYLEATQAVLHRYNRLWFQDESYIVSRKRD